MKFKKTTVANLLKGENGTYYLRARIYGKLVWRALDTKAFSVAKLRLPDKLAELRALPVSPVKTEAAPTKMRFADAVALYRADVMSATRIADGTKTFRLRFEHPLKRTWPELFEMELRRVTPDACQAWMKRFEQGASRYVSSRAKRSRAGNSSTSINGIIGFLRRVFDIGVKGGYVSRNPAIGLERKAPKRKLLRLPNKTKFAALVAHISTQPGWGTAAAHLVESLAYSGARIGEMRRLTWGHIDFEKGMLTIPGEKTDHAPRVVPMTGDFRRVVLSMQKVEEPAHDASVFRVKTALDSLASGCMAVGIPKLTHHDLRHLFATTCIESGVDVPTVSNWLGHADGGALAMRTYGHIRPEHSIEAVKKVSFTVPKS